MVRRFEIFLFLCWYAVTRPTWAYYWLVVVIGGRTVGLHPFAPDASRVRSVEAALAELFTAERPSADTVFDPRGESENPAVPLSFDVSNALLALLDGTIRALRPAKVVEVGVARGATSRVILEALHALQAGTLHSVEFPVPRFGYRAAVGSLVPPSLRGGWELIFGPEKTELPPLLKRLGTIDLFLHDAAHNYAEQRDAIDLVLPYLRPGGVLIMDDLFSSAFADTCKRHALDYLLVRQPGKSGLIGILRKPS